MSEPIQQEGATGTSAEKRGWNVAWFGWLKNPPEFVAAFCYLLGYLFASLWLIAIVTIIGRLFLISIGLMQPSDRDGDIKAATVLLPTLAAVAAAPFLIWRLIMMQSQTTTALEKLEIDRETQNTALYLKAVEMLGAMKEEKGFDEEHNVQMNATVVDLEKRLGAIYALEHLASTTETFQPAILSMLCAYIRTNGGQDKYESPISPPSKGDEWPKPRADIQVAVDVIGTRKEKWKNKAKIAGDIQLENAKLASINLSGKDFSGADFQFSFMNNVIGYDSNFKGCIFINADMTGAILEESNLVGAIFHKTVLQNSSFLFSKIQRTNLSKAVGCSANQFRSSEGDKHTSLPEHCIRPDHWSTSTKEGAEAPSPPDAKG